MFETAKDRICLALDPDPEKMIAEEDYRKENLLLNQRLDTLKGGIGAVKLNSTFDMWGDCAYAVIQNKGLALLADWKLKDIPNTVAARVRAIRRHKVWGITIHASGGPKMVEAAATAADGKVIIFAVTILTSLDNGDLAGMYGDKIPPTEVLVPHLAKMATENGADGIICSPKETASVREVVDPHIIIGNPGIRFLKDNPTEDDQKRTATPASAIRAGADFVVMGRDLKDESDCARAVAEIDGVLAERW